MASDSSREKWHTKRQADCAAGQKATVRAVAVVCELLPQCRRNLFYKQQSDDGLWGELMSSLTLAVGENFGVFEGEVGMGIRKQQLQSEFGLLRYTGRWFSSHVPN